MGKTMDRGAAIPLPPVFARVVEESEGCRAVALAEADAFYLVIPTRRASTRKANNENGEILLGLHFAEQVRRQSILYRLENLVRPVGRRAQG
jgi:hypothetical protein